MQTKFLTHFRSLLLFFEGRYVVCYRRSDNNRVCCQGNIHSDVRTKLQKIYRELFMRCIKVYECFKCFHEGRKMTILTNISGWSITIRTEICIASVHTSVRGSHWSTVYELPEDVKRVTIPFIYASVAEDPFKSYFKTLLWHLGVDHLTFNFV